LEIRTYETTKNSKELIMEIYLSKKFMESLWFKVSFNEKEIELFFNKKFLPHLNDCTIVFDYKSEKDMLSDDIGRLIIEEITNNGNIPNIIYQANFDDEKELNETLKKNGTKIFFVELSNNEILHFEQQYGYQLISSSTFEEKFGFHKENWNVEKLLSVHTEDSDAFKSWSDLNFVSKVPTNSIVIVDSFILIENSENKIKHNLIPLLGNLIPPIYSGDLHILILSYLIRGKSNVEQKKIAEKIHRKLNSHFAKIKHLKIKFSIINFDKKYNTEDQAAIHDRYVYTNYYTLQSTTGFDDLFKGSKRNIKNSRLIIRFNFERLTLKANNKEIKDLQDYISKIKSAKGDYFKMIPENIKCPLLNM